MTTKLTEADVKSLPCKGCGCEPAVHGAHVCCETPGCWVNEHVQSVLFDQWRLLMTPDAKGEMTVEQTIYELRRAINRELDIDISTSYKLEEAQKEMAEARTIAAGRVAAYEATVKELRAQRDSLQSKLAKSEERVKHLEAKYEGSLKTYAEVRTELTNAQQQLAEATKPMGDEELEKAIKMINSRMVYWDNELGAMYSEDAVKILIRAARQRKPSGDAVKLAQMVKDRHEHSGGYNAEKYKLDKNQYPHDWNIGLGALMQPLADSILAQAGEDKSARVPAADLLTLTGATFDQIASEIMSRTTEFYLSYTDKSGGNGLATGRDGTWNHNVNFPSPRTD